MGAVDKLCFWVLTLVVQPGALGGRWAVRYPEELVCAVRGSTVVFPCTYEHPEGQQVREKIWCHNDTDCIETQYIFHNENVNVSSEYRDRAECLVGKEKNCSLKIKNIRHSDAGQYRFRFITNKDKWYGPVGVTLQVDELKVKLTSSAGDGTIKEGDSVNVTCSSEICPLSQSEFTWFKDSRRLPETQSTLHLSPVSLHHSGHYSCAVKHHENTTSAKLSLEVEDTSGLPLLVIVVVTLLAVLAVVVILLIYKSRRKSPDKDGTEGQIAEEPSYVTVAQYDFSQSRNHGEAEPLQEEDVSYAAIHFNTKKPPKTCNVSMEQSDIIYSSVVNHTANNS